LVVDEVEVEVVTVNIRNRDLRQRGGHVFNDMALPNGVYFKPGEIKTLEISEVEATKLKQRKDATWELTTTPPALADDEEEASEPTSSEASLAAAEAEAEAAEAEAELIDESPQRVQRRRL
jgi:hypothetical protein